MGIALSTGQGTRSSLATSPQSVPFRFMDLPPELRLLVYEDLLVVGKVFYTPDRFDIMEGSRFKDHKLYRKPDVQIFRVSKEVHREAEEIYLTKNLFVLPRFWHWRHPIFWDAGDRAEKTDRWLFSPSAVAKIKHVSVAFCTRSEVPLAMTHSDWTYDGTFDRITPAERLQKAHEEALCWLDGQRDDMLVNLWRFENVRSLEVDLTNAFCPLGCCRQLDLEWERLQAVKPENFRFLGLRHKAEATALLDSWSACMGLSREDLKLRFSFEINPDSDPWEHLKASK